MDKLDKIEADIAYLKGYLTGMPTKWDTLLMVLSANIIVMTIALFILIGAK